MADPMISRTWLRLLGFAAVAQLIGSGASFAQECPANAHIDRVEQSGNTRTIHCKCNEGFENKGGACQGTGIISDNERELLKDAPIDILSTRENNKIYWASSRRITRNDC